MVLRQPIERVGCPEELVIELAIVNGAEVLNGLLERDSRGMW